MMQYIQCMFCHLIGGNSVNGYAGSFGNLNNYTCSKTISQNINTSFGCNFTGSIIFENEVNSTVKKKVLHIKWIFYLKKVETI